MRSTITRRLVAGFTAGVAAAAASAVVLLAPTAAEAGHTLSIGSNVAPRGHTLP
jgi:hypothetical protein